MSDYHSFSCAAGDTLSQIGAAWLISYLHASLVGGNNEWTLVESTDLRKKKVKSAFDFVPYWIGYIGGQITHGDDKLANNSIGLDFETAKKYYYEIVEYIDKNKGKIDINKFE